LLAGAVGGVAPLGAPGAAPEEPVEPVLPLEGLFMGEEDEPGVVVVSPTFLLQAPNASAAVIANAVTATDTSLLSYISISFQEWTRTDVRSARLQFIRPAGFPHEKDAHQAVGVFRMAENLPAAACARFSRRGML
jgi:hypothetical protein